MQNIVPFPPRIPGSMLEDSDGCKVTILGEIVTTAGNNVTVRMSDGTSVVCGILADELPQGSKFIEFEGQVKKEGQTIKVIKDSGAKVRPLHDVDMAFMNRAINLTYNATLTHLYSLPQQQ
ncbi:unnamed protein product [Vitrella brassicaformis CCMP3155]|uniref:Replication factor A protein 3 n=2 Tax=Vitrella brassicaformis TaxID=1169539 RepID=A0A0G4H373_VITBC|nr:unnamed protein product [Vitrella brassicaformis CCMP3155]|eukprot:CEM38151.1 unnamed protein product [Vitrella brassicaformis CCMP3155]